MDDAVQDVRSSFLLVPKVENEDSFWRITTYQRSGVDPDGIWRVNLGWAATVAQATRIGPSPVACEDTDRAARMPNQDRWSSTAMQSNLQYCIIESRIYDEW